MESKKSTLLLTVIAVATLLVAVVGASFAFFAIQAESEGEVEITTTTAKGSDIFTATASGDLVISVTNEKMTQAAGNNDETIPGLTDTDSSMVVSLTAGSGTAECTYTIEYTQAADTNTYSASKVDGVAYTGKEYTIAGTSTYAKATHAIEETNMDKVTTFGPFTITDTAEAANPQTATTETWTLTAKFYNLTIDQKDQLDKTFAGSFKVVPGTCVNNG